MVAVVKIKMFGEELFQHRLRNLKAEVYNPKVALNEIADDMLRVIGATFSSQGRRYGGSWHALDKDTVKEKRAAGEDPRILIATGKLYKAYSVRGAPRQVLRITRSGITLGSTLPYAGVHQYGTDDVPQRQFVNFFPQDKARWAKMMEDSFDRAWRSAGATKAGRVK